jgi:hypothetical protein
MNVESASIPSGMFVESITANPLAGDSGTASDSDGDGAGGAGAVVGAGVGCGILFLLGALYYNNKKKEKTKKVYEEPAKYDLSSETPTVNTQLDDSGSEDESPPARQPTRPVCSRRYNNRIASDKTTPRRPETGKKGYTAYMNSKKKEKKAHGPTCTRSKPLPCLGCGSARLGLRTAAPAYPRGPHHPPPPPSPAHGHMRGIRKKKDAGANHSP